MKCLFPLVLAAAFAALPATAQNVPDIGFDSVANALTLP